MTILKTNFPKIDIVLMMNNFVSFRSLPEPHILPRSQKCPLQSEYCHKFCNQEKCIDAAKRSKPVEAGIRRLNLGSSPRNKQINVQTEEKSIQTVLKSKDCQFYCPVFREVGVKTDCVFDSSESIGSSSSSEYVVRKCEEIVKTWKFQTIKSVFTLQGPEIEGNVSQCKIFYSITKE